MFITFVCLGTWQLARLQNKNKLIHTFYSNQNKDLQNEQKINVGKEDLYKKVFLEGSFINKPIYFYATKNKKQGYEIILPFVTKKNNYFLVNLGFSQKKLNVPSNYTPHKVSGNVTHLSSKKPYGISNDLKNNVWFYIDDKELNKFYNVDTFAQIMIIPDDPKLFLGEVVVLKDKIIFRNDHLGYAITWYSLGIVVLFMVIAMHKKNLKLVRK